MPHNDDKEQITRIVIGLNGLTEKVMRGLTLDITANLVETTPVDIGWARANWVPSLKAPIDNDPGKKPNEGDTAIANAAQAAATVKAALYKIEDGFAFITNNVQYIQRLNEGHSSQAPAGFVEAAIDSAVDTAVENLGLFSVKEPSP